MGLLIFISVIFLCMAYQYIREEVKDSKGKPTRNDWRSHFNN